MRYRLTGSPLRGTEETIVLRRYPIRLGSMLYTLVEPSRERAVEYNRWYEGDHFYESVLGPGVLQGRRFVATRDHKALRYPDPNPITGEWARGSLLSVYWLLDGEAYETWGASRARALHDAGRMFPERAHVHTQLYDLAWFAAGDDDGVTPELALDHPFAGMVTVIGECPDADARSRLGDWYRDERLPGYFERGQVALCLAFVPRPIRSDAPDDVPKLAAHSGRYLHLYFLEQEPSRSWPATFAGEGDAVATTGLGEAVFASGFVPTVPGTDRCLDQLW
ncbi:MAG: hypothetical protein AMXMBFR46_23950 [Acidimicrobiia bacterium]